MRKRNGLRCSCLSPSETETLLAAALLCDALPLAPHAASAGRVGTLVRRTIAGARWPPAPWAEGVAKTPRWSAIAARTPCRAWTGSTRCLATSAKRGGGRRRAGCTLKAVQPLLLVTSRRHLNITATFEHHSDSECAIQFRKNTRKQAAGAWSETSQHTHSALSTLVGSPRSCPWPPPTSPRPGRPGRAGQRPPPPGPRRAPRRSAPRIAAR